MTNTRMRLAVFGSGVRIPSAPPILTTERPGTRVHRGGFARCFMHSMTRLASVCVCEASMYI